MPRAEVGSTKWQANKIKQKGLTRLRWYCQVCEKPCRDQNGFKCHTMSESHQRKMMLVAQNQKKEIEDRSRMFQKAFLDVLRTSHGTKFIDANRVYNEYIADPHHHHMNATKWNNLTLFVHHLGREGICRVEAKEDSDGSASGLQIAWIDNSPEALRRKEALQKAERSRQGDEDRQQRMLDEQVRRSQAERAPEKEVDEKARELHLAEGENVKLNFSFGRPAQKPPTADISAEKPKEKAKNVFAAKRNPLAGSKKTSSAHDPPKKMSEMERIMKEEQERKRKREMNGVADGSKRIKV